MGYWWPADGCRVCVSIINKSIPSLVGWNKRIGNCWFSRNCQTEYLRDENIYRCTRLVFFNINFFIKPKKCIMVIKISGQLQGQSYRWCTIIHSSPATHNVWSGVIFGTAFFSRLQFKEWISFVALCRINTIFNRDCVNGKQRIQCNACCNSRNQPDRRTGATQTEEYRNTFVWLTAVY